MLEVKIFYGCIMEKNNYKDKMCETKPLLIYFSSVTENTKRFVEKLGFDNIRLPLHKKEQSIIVEQPYILVVPSYGGGQTEPKKAIPLRVLEFLQRKEHRELCIGVISSGNINFNESFLIAGHLLSSKLHVPLLFGFELAGTPSDVEKCRQGIKEKWDYLVDMRKKYCDNV